VNKAPGTGGIAVLIPAYKPTAAVVDLVRDLQALDSAGRITGYVVVNDGSGEDFTNLFAQVAAFPRVTILPHAVNLGKGAALKSGMNHILTRLPDVRAIVTADADGQHAPENVMMVVNDLAARPDKVVLGVRQFDPNTPLRSAFGNGLTRLVFRTFTGVAVSDTQTGLRGLPVEFCRRCLRIPLNGYDFELEELILAGRQSQIVEIPIKTIYIEGNKSSHFNPVRDSLRIYFVFLRFVGSSVITAIVDYTVFVLALAMTGSVGWSQAIARTLAIGINFVLAKEAVFRAHENVRVAFAKFVLLVIANGFVSYGMIRFMNEHWDVRPVPAKLAAEGLLFLANFAIQRELIFTSARPERGP
jgi:putative flippase GtrA